MRTPTLQLQRISFLPPNANPFKHDLVRMGRVFAQDWTMMYMHHPHEQFKTTIFIHTPTGVRFALDMKPEPRPGPPTSHS